MDYEYVLLEQREVKVVADHPTDPPITTICWIDGGLVKAANREKAEEQYLAETKIDSKDGSPVPTKRTVCAVALSNWNPGTYGSEPQPDKLVVSRARPLRKRKSPAPAAPPTPPPAS